MKVNRGDIILVDFPLASQPTSKIRPAVVIQCDLNNRRLDNTIVAQITSRTRSSNEPTRLAIDPATEDGKVTGLHGLSVVACENIVTIRQDAIIRILGRLTDTMLNQVDECLKASIGIG